ncbi:helix-turn-helix domain-containing protein [Thermodesulfobacteriota bacterium]
MSRKKYPHSENTVGARLRLYRKSKNLTSTEMSKILGISQGSLSDIENNKTDPSSKPIDNLIHNTDINIYWLYTGDGDMIFFNKSSLSFDKFSDPKINELFEATLRILNSGNSIAIDALEHCIKIFDQTVQTEKRLDSLEDEISELKGETKKHKKGLAA